VEVDRNDCVVKDELERSSQWLMNLMIWLETRGDYMRIGFGEGQCREKSQGMGWFLGPMMKDAFYWDTPWLGVSK